MSGAMHARGALWLVAALALFAACDDPPLDDDNASGAGDVVDEDVTGTTGDGQAVDAATDGGAAPVDAGGGAVDTAGAVQDADLPPDAGAVDAGQPDIAADIAADAAPDAAADAAVADPCGDCPWNAQPGGDHPAAASKVSQLEPKKVEYGNGLLEGFKEMLVIEPLSPGVHPVLFFVQGKQLHTTGGILSAKLGKAYMAMLEHIARRGYIVAFVRVENLATDCDFGKMADYLLQASVKLFAKYSTADSDRVAFAGHSMGAKVAILAAARTLLDDKEGKWADPEAVFAFNVGNEKPAVCFAPWMDAAAAVKYFDAKAQVRFTFVDSDDDAITPYKDPKKPNALAIYEALPIKYKQMIVLHGTGKGDKNVATQPELHDDHSACLTVEGSPGGVAGWAMPDSHLDALDWYGFWKILAGGLDFHFLKGDPKWAYGELRSHGGTLPGGGSISHEVFKQGW